MPNSTTRQCGCEIIPILAGSSYITNGHGDDRDSLINWRSAHQCRQQSVFAGILQEHARRRGVGISTGRSQLFRCFLATSRFYQPARQPTWSRLVSGKKNTFKWHVTKWDDSDNNYCVSRRLGNWTRFTIPLGSSAATPEVCLYAWAKFLSDETTNRHMWTWLAQAEPLREQIREHDCVLDDNILIGSLS